MTGLSQGTLGLREEERVLIMSLRLFSATATGLWIPSLGLARLNQVFMCYEAGKCNEEEAEHDGG